MNNTTKFIHKTVYENAIIADTKARWQEYRHNVRKRLEQLQPDICEDGSTNRLAFNVGSGKPRMKIKTGRFLTKKLQLNSGYLDDVAIQKIASTINFHLFGSYIEVKLINGSAITDAYKNEVGTTSCMTGDCADYTKLYESNPTRFQMLTMFYGNNSARAIVHKLDNGMFLLDKIYSDCEDLKTRMIDYAIEHNWYYRRSNEASDCVIFDAQYEIDNYDDIVVSGLSYSDGEVPYMDTLTEYRLQNDTIDIFHCHSSYIADGTLDSTSGELESSRYCDNCGESMYGDDVYCVGDYVVCQGCYNGNYFYCEKCGEDCHNDDAVCMADTKNCICQYCANSSCYQCEDCDEYFEETDSLYSTYYEQYVCESCIENYARCGRCNECFTSDDMGENNRYCNNCQSKDANIPEQNESDTGKLPFEESIKNVE